MSPGGSTQCVMMLQSSLGGNFIYAMTGSTVRMTLSIMGSKAAVSDPSITYREESNLHRPLHDHSKLVKRSCSTMHRWQHHHISSSSQRHMQLTSHAASGKCIRSSTCKRITCATCMTSLVQAVAVTAQKLFTSCLQGGFGICKTRMMATVAG